MKQYRLSRFGIDGLALVDAPEPRPGSRDMLVRWHAWSLNYRDPALVEGDLAPDLPLPFTPISDAAGEVFEVGREVTAFKSADRVVSQFFIDTSSSDDKRARAYTLGTHASNEGDQKR